jgi:hypothetical protein
LIIGKLNSAIRSSLSHTVPSVTSDSIDSPFGNISAMITIVIKAIVILKNKLWDVNISDNFVIN